jgi:PST family polysaccharide transporter
VGVALLERKRDYRAISMASMAGNLVYTGLAIAMALQGYGLWSLVVPTLVQVVLEAGLNTARARLPLSTPPSRFGASTLFHAGAATTATQILNWAGLNGPSLITSNLLGPYVLGFYARATNLQNTALQLSGGPVGRVLVPTFASLQHAPDRLRDTFKRFMGAVLPLNALVSMVAVVHGEAIVRLLLGRKWFAAIPIVQLLFLGFMPRSAYKVTEALALALGQYGAAAVRQAIYLLAVLAGALIGGAFGVLPLTLGVSLGMWVFYGFSLAQAEELSGVGWRWIGRAHLKALVLALTIGLPDAAVVFVVRHLRHPANPASFKALILILASHAAGALVGMAVLAFVVWRFGDWFGPQVQGAWARAAALVRAASARLSPLRAP